MFANESKPTRIGQPRVDHSRPYILSYLSTLDWPEKVCRGMGGGGLLCCRVRDKEKKFWNTDTRSLPPWWSSLVGGWPSSSPSGILKSQLGTTSIQVFQIQIRLPQDHQTDDWATVRAIKIIYRFCSETDLFSATTLNIMTLSIVAELVIPNVVMLTVM